MRRAPCALSYNSGRKVTARESSSILGPLTARCRIVIVTQLATTRLQPRPASRRLLARIFKWLAHLRIRKSF